MTRVINYCRVSTDEQAEKGYSLQEQGLRLKKYAEAENMTVIRELSEDFSAKTFNRPVFSQMMLEIKSKKIKADVLLVTKIDRFSRDLFLAYNVVADLLSYGIRVVSITEGELDFTNPHKFFPLIVQTGAAQYDNMLRSENTKRGMRQAMKEGRCVFTPPKGYVNNKITKRIEIDESIAKIVRWSFEEYGKGVYSAEEVRHSANKMGLELTKQAFLNMLKNPMYMGKILVPRIKDEPEEMVIGQHEALISDALFYTVQEILAGRRKPYKQPKEDIKNALPLRGHLICSKCGRILTGGTPKGNGGKYPYYHCQQTKYGCKHRFSAKTAHDSMKSYLEEFQPNDEVINGFKAVLDDIFNTNDSLRLSNKKLIEEQVQVLDDRINKIEDDYSDDRISVQDYSKLNKKYEAQKNELVMKHAVFAKTPPLLKYYISYSSGLMQNLSSYYVSSAPSTQHKLIGLIFPEKLTFTGTEYKTNKMNEVFSLIANIDKGLKENSLATNARLSIQAPPSGLEPETL